MLPSEYSSSMWEGKGKIIDNNHLIMGKFHNDQEIIPERAPAVLPVPGTVKLFRYSSASDYPTSHDKQPKNSS